MKLRIRFALCGLVLFMIFGSCAAETSPARAESTAAEPFHVEIHGVDSAQFTQVYRDADGKPIEAATFTKAIKDGNSFTPAIDPAKKIITLTLQSAASQQRSLAIRVHQKLPEFHLPMVGQQKASSMTLVGKPTLVDFFFADCVACIEELPALDAYAARHPEMHFLAITFDDAEVAKTFVHKRDFKWPVAYEGMPLIKKLNVGSFPTMLLLDAQGALLASHTGSIPVEVKRDKASTNVQPSRAEVEQSQLRWLRHWVANTLSPAASDNG